MFDPEDLDTWEKFETDVGMYIYTVNVFPDTAESNEAADNLAIKYTSEIINLEKYDYEADKVIRCEVSIISFIWLVWEKLDIEYGGYPNFYYDA